MFTANIASRLCLRAVLFIALALSVFLAGRQWLYAQQQLPAGTVIPVLLETTLDSDKIKTGKRVLTEVGQDIRLENGGVIPVGSKLLGWVTKLGSESGGSTVTVRFDRLLPRKSKEPLPIEIRLRALASPLQVNDAGHSTSYGVGIKNESSNWTTTQVGGDVVYRGGGQVWNSVGEPVGKSVHGGLFDPWSGVLVTVSNPAGSACQNLPLSMGQQSLWIFSSSACGVYGFEYLRYENLPGGEIVFSAPGQVKVPGGSALMLTVAAQTAAPTEP
jgi:hypothetical protein